MSIQKKSLISTLKTAKKANVASAHETDAKGSKVASMRVSSTRQVAPRGALTLKQISGKAVGHTKASARTTFKAI